MESSDGLASVGSPMGCPSACANARRQRRGDRWRTSSSPSRPNSSQSGAKPSGEYTGSVASGSDRQHTPRRGPSMPMARVRPSGETVKRICILPIGRRAINLAIVGVDDPQCVAVAMRHGYPPALVENRAVARAVAHGDPPVTAVAAH